MYGRFCSRHSDGFTLIELVLSIVLVGIIAAVGSSMISDSLTTARMVNAESASAGQARYALERLAREIREIKYDRSSASYCITAKTNTNLVFFKSSGAYNSTCSTNAITVSINRDSADPNLTLQYSSLPAATSTLSSQVSGFNLEYYDVGGGPNPSTAAIRFVVITLTTIDPTSGQSISQRTRVALRNG